MGCFHLLAALTIDVQCAVLFKDIAEHFVAARSGIFSFVNSNWFLLVSRKAIDIWIFAMDSAMLLNTYIDSHNI